MNNESFLDENGYYRWVSELNLFSNPTVFFTLFRVFTLSSVLGFGALFIICSISDGGIAWEMFYAFIFTYIALIILLSISYLLYALLNKGKYCVAFELTTEYLLHKQIHKKFNKNQVLNALQILIGVSSKNLLCISTGILAGTRQSMLTKLISVDKIIANKKKNTIKLRNGIRYNHIYTENENYDVILKFILDNVAGDVIKSIK